jgi:hypothetical protein
MSAASIGNHFTGTFFSAATLGVLGHLVSKKIGAMTGTVFGISYGISGLVLDPLFNTKDSHPLSCWAGVALKVAASTAVVLKVLNHPLTLASAIQLGRQIVHKSPPIVFGLIIAILFVEIISEKIKKNS